MYHQRINLSPLAIMIESITIHPFLPQNPIGVVNNRASGDTQSAPPMAYYHFLSLKRRVHESAIASHQ